MIRVLARVLASVFVTVMPCICEAAWWINNPRGDNQVTASYPCDGGGPLNSTENLYQFQWSAGDSTWYGYGYTTTNKDDPNATNVITTSWPTRLW